MTDGVRYTLAVGSAALMVAAAAELFPFSVRSGVWLGVGIGLLTQVAVFWLMFVALFPARRMLAHGLGMVSRLMVFALMALVALRWPVSMAASTLFALVAVFFVGTVMEPLFLRSEPLKRS